MTPDDLAKMSRATRDALRAELYRYLSLIGERISVQALARAGEPPTDGQIGRLQAHIEVMAAVLQIIEKLDVGEAQTS